MFSFDLGSRRGGGDDDDADTDPDPDADTVVKITLSLLNVVLIIASVLYIWCLVLAVRKLTSLQRQHRQATNNNSNAHNNNNNNNNNNVPFGMKKVLVISIVLIAAVRIMTFIGVTAMDIANVRAHYSPNPSSSSSAAFDDEKQMHVATAAAAAAASDNQNFYDSSMTILFDLPNAIVVSTYVLLTLVWAECFLQSRYHTEPMIQWKTTCLKGYTIFNACLFSGQLILYLLLFWPGTDRSVKVVKGVIYTGMIVTNLGACGIAAFSYFCLNIRFAGFPYKSINVKQSLRKISIVFFIWSTSRLTWAISNIVVFTYGIELLHDSDDPILSALVLFSLLLFCEILPMMIMLDYSYIPIISFEQRRYNYGDSRTRDNDDDDDNYSGTFSGCFRNSDSGSNNDNNNNNNNNNDAHDWWNSNQEEQYNENGISASVSTSAPARSRGFWSNLSESLLSSSIQEEQEEEEVEIEVEDESMMSEPLLTGE